MFLEYEFPANLTPENFISRLAAEVDVQPVSRQIEQITYYDSFDWRLHASGLVCEFIQIKKNSSLLLKSIETGHLIGSLELKKAPVFSDELEPGIVRDSLEPVLEMRALLPVCSLDSETHHLNIVNKDRKTILRLRIEQYSQLNPRVLLQPVKGYDKATEHVAEILTTKLDLTVADKPILPDALRLQGRKPQDYSSRLSIHLEPDMRADLAGKHIYSHLLKTIKLNEQGTIANTDSEFLHDFRVAVRRTRAGLSQIKGILPAEAHAYFSDFFGWLGQITGPTRDLDVYLLSFDAYKHSLPEAIRNDLDPLYDFLLAKQRKTQKELAKQLQSSKYQATLSEWESYLKQPSFKMALGVNATLTIKELADRRIWKMFNRVLDEGDAIIAASPAEALHDLRKTCKKLRYLMEFFQSLYPEQQIKRLIKNLKELQEVLGGFQDFAVQERHLRLFSEEMRMLATPANTFLAMGVLIQALEGRRCSARRDFSAKFEHFKQEENRAAFKSLFARPKPD
ncbi:MAG: CHAD domain-containing protein [Methylobacter sp.]